MAINKIPESQLPTRSVSETDYVRVVGADGKSYRVPKTDFNGGGGGGTIDGSLSPTSTNAVQNKAIYSALEGLKADLGDLSDLDTTVKTDLVSAINEVASGGGGALTQDTKQALLQCFAHTAWTDDQGQDYYDDLEDALYPFDLLSSISAVYTQSGTVYDTDSLDSLKTDLVVTGQYSDSTSNTIRNYTLSGSLTVGTSTITVTYGGKTATFTVNVTQSAAVLTSISAVYTQSGTVYDTDSLDSLKADLVVTAHYSDSTTETVPSTDYTLSGTLSVGTSTVTVSYSGKTTTFNVTVSEQGLPTGYTQYDYVYNNTKATQSNIDTQLGGQYCTDAYEHELTVQFDGAPRTTSDGFFGLRSASGSDPKARAYWEQKQGNGDYALACNYNGIDTGFYFVFALNTKYKLVTKNKQWLINDVLIYDNMDSGSYEAPTSGTIRLLGVYTATQVSAYPRNTVRIYGYKVKDLSTGILIANMVPCTNESGVAGLYDKIRHSFYSAQTQANLSAANDEV